MGKKRIYGSNVQLNLFHQDIIPEPVYIGELESFSAKSNTTAIKSRPIGTEFQGVTLQYGGWDLSFDGNKADWALSHFYSLQEQTLRIGTTQPPFIISERIIYYDGTIEHYIYPFCTLFGLELERKDELSEKISGFAPMRIAGPLDTTAFKMPGSVEGVLNSNVLREEVFLRSIIKNFTNYDTKKIQKGVGNIISVIQDGANNVMSDFNSGGQ